MNTHPDINNSASDAFSNIQFTEVLNLEDIQRFQNLFSDASGVASIITLPDGTPITKPSNFCRLCNDIIRKTEKGLANCHYSDAVLGSHNPSGSELRQCLSGGLWDAGAKISVGGKHIANWLIGQVRNEEIDEQRMLLYADEIGANKEDFMQALKEVPFMSVEQLKKIHKMLFAFANELSEKAYTNLQLKMQIAEQELSTEALRHSEERLNYAQEIVQMGSWDYNLITKEFAWSENYYRMLGLQSNDKGITNDDFEKMIHPDDAHLTNDMLQEIYKNKVAVSADLRLIMPDGKIKWIQDNVVPVIEGDLIIALKGVIIDITSDKRTKKRIKTQNERLNAIIRAMPDLIFVMDKQGTIIEYYTNNPDILLAPEEQVIGTALDTLFDEETVNLHLQKIDACIQEKKLVTYEYSVNVDHSIRYFEARLAPIGPDRVLTFVRDITEKRLNEVKLKKLSQAVEQSPDLIVITGLNANIEYVNPAFEALTGYSSAELIGQNPRILKSGKTNEAIYKNLWNTITKGKDWHGEWINKKKNGEFYWENISITPIRDRAGEIKNYLAIKQDITQRKQAEKEIRDLNANLEFKIAQRTVQLAKTNADLLKEIDEHKLVAEDLRIKTIELEHFFRVSLDLLCIADTSGNFVKVNNAWENILGYSSYELEHKQFLEFVHPEDIQQTYDVMLQLINKNPILDFTNRYKTKDGSYRFMEWHAIPVGDLVYAAARDITERKIAEDEIRNARLDAEQANMAKSEFLSRMSHELRTPLNSILGFAQLLEMGELNPGQKKGVGHILQSGKHLLGLINEVLDISRIEAGRISLSPESIVLTDIIAEMIDLVQPLATVRQLSIQMISSPNKQLSVMADSRRLKQVLLNLLNNAVKYNKIGGSIFIKTNTMPMNEAGIVPLRISITDTGLGISTEDITKLFKPFERIGAEKTETEGTGLGLAVVKKLIDAMEGSFGVESIPNEGSTFWIELPYNERQNEKA